MKAAPLLVSFNSVGKYLDALPEDKKIEHAEKIQFLVDKSYPPVVSAYCLSVLFGYSYGFIYAMIKYPERFYRSFYIKQGKKTRKINSPKVALKVVQKWLGYHLGCAIEFPSHVFGFVSGRSFADAAAQHIGANWVLSVDIVDFFPSITKADVSTALQSIGYSRTAADLVADLCCLNGVLAQGSPASPVLSNIFMTTIDENLSELAERYNVRVTRYADDIVFSGADRFDENLRNELINVFAKTTLRLNNDKSYFAEVAKGQRLKVHGLLVQDKKITLTKGYRNKLRAYKHMMKVGKVCEQDMKRINGHIKFGEFIEAKIHKAETK